MFSVIIRLKMPIDYHFCSFLLPSLCMLIAMYSCMCLLIVMYSCMCLLIAMYVHVDCHIWAFCIPEQLSHMGHFCACSLRCMCLLIAMSVPVDCHMWACCGPKQFPHMDHFCACWITFIGLLIVIYVPVDCHMWVSCLPHKCLLFDTCGPHVGQTDSHIFIWPKNKIKLLAYVTSINNQ